MPKFKEVAPGYFQFHCPGCKRPHWVNTSILNCNEVLGFKDVWEFNGDLDKPTVSPSIFVNQGGLNPTAPICHSFIKEGKIQFLSDCTHNMAGQTVELPEID